MHINFTSIILSNNLKYSQSRTARLRPYAARDTGTYLLTPGSDVYQDQHVGLRFMAFF